MYLAGPVLVRSPRWAHCDICTQKLLRAAWPVTPRVRAMSRARHSLPGVERSTVQTAARRHGGTAARRHGGTAARRHGGTAARRHGGTAARRHGGTAARRHGGTAARRHGGTAARRRGGWARALGAAGTWEPLAGRGWRALRVGVCGGVGTAGSQMVTSIAVMLVLVRGLPVSV